MAGDSSRGGRYLDVGRVADPATGQPICFSLWYPDVRRQIIITNIDTRPDPDYARIRAESRADHATLDAPEEPVPGSTPDAAVPDRDTECIR